MKMYAVDDLYIKYLRTFDPKVRFNEGINYTKSRKYVGHVIDINECKYFIPLCSPKESDYIIQSGIKVVRPDSIPIIRVFDTSKNKLYASLDIGNMIPVPDECLILYDVDGESDIPYRDLILAEIAFIKSNEFRIIKNAQILYSQKTRGSMTQKYLQHTTNFLLLEEKSKEYSKI